MVYTVNCRCNGKGGAEDVPPLSSSSEESDMMYASRASTLVGKAGAGGWGSMGERHEERRCVGGGHEEGLTPIQEGQGLIRTHSTFSTYSPWKPGLCQFPVRIHLPTYTCARRQCHGLFRRTPSGTNYGSPYWCTRIEWEAREGTGRMDGIVRACAGGPGSRRSTWMSSLRAFKRLRTRPPSSRARL